MFTAVPETKTYTRTITFCFLLIICNVLAAAAQTQVDVGLCAFVAATNVQQQYPSWSCSIDGIPIGDPCEWTGIYCSGSNITKFYLQNTGLSGTLPSSLSLLTDMNYLNLAGDAITGTIPSEISNMTKLQLLDLCCNSFSGRLPPSLGSLTALQYLSLAGNAFTGRINGLNGTHLSRLYINSNRFTGPIPNALVFMPVIDIAALSDNLFTGTIPSQTAVLWPRISDLDLDGNAITGTIPSEISNMTRLRSLSLNDALLTGTVPSTLCSLPYLTYLSIGKNVECYPTCLANPMASGTIPRSDCSICRAGEYMSDPATYSCTPCPPDTYLSIRTNDTSCSACPAYDSTAGQTGKTFCFYRWTNDPVVIQAVLGCIAAMYVLSFIAAGEKSLAIMVNMFLPILDHITDTFYLINEPFFSVLLFQLCFFFLLAPCIVFGYELIEEQDFPRLYVPFAVLWLGSSGDQPTFRGEALHNGNISLWPLWACLQVLTLLAALCWWMLYGLFLLFWFVVGSFLHNSRTMCVVKLRRTWYWVWSGTKQEGDAAGALVDTGALNRMLFIGTMLESVPQLVIQLFNSVMVGWGVAAQLSIAVSVMMTVACCYKFMYWHFYRGMPWEDIPVAPLIPKVSFLQLSSTPSCSDPAYFAETDKKHRLAGKESSSVTAVENSDEPTSGCKAADAACQEYDIFEYHPPATAFRLLIWLQYHGGLPTYRGLRVFATFDVHDNVLKFIYLFHLWLVCIVLQLITLVIAPVHLPLMWLGVNVFDTSLFKSSPRGWLKCICLIISLYALVFVLSNKAVQLSYYPNRCTDFIKYDVSSPICRDSYYALAATSCMQISGYMVLIFQRIFNDSSLKRLFTYLVAGAIIFVLVDIDILDQDLLIDALGLYLVVMLSCLNLIDFIKNLPYWGQKDSTTNVLLDAISARSEDAIELAQVLAT